MNDDIELIHSPLECKIERDGHIVDVHLYRTEGSPWILEVVNAGGTSICWDDHFATDQDALGELMRTIDEEGIEALAIDAPGTTLS